MLGSKMEGPEGWSSSVLQTWALVYSITKSVSAFLLLRGQRTVMPFMRIISYIVPDNKRTESRTEIHREAMPVKPF